MKTLDEQIQCVRREIGMRERVYPSRIANGKMTAATAAHEIETMEHVLATLEQQRTATVQRNRDLFGE